MSSEATKKFLLKILSNYSKPTVESRITQQRKATHSITQNIDELASVIRRAQQLYNLPGNVTDKLIADLSASISNLQREKGNTKLTFNQILKARASIGVFGSADTGKDRSTYYLKDVNGEVYLDANGGKIELHKILQLGHDESITTLQTKAVLNRLIRYKSSYKSNLSEGTQAQDAKLIDAFINIFRNSTNLLAKVDDISILENILDKSTIAKNTTLTSAVLKEWKKGGTPIHIDISVSPDMQLVRREKPSGVRFEVASDNGIKGNISAGIKSGILKGAEVLLFKSLTKGELKKAAFRSVKPSYTDIAKTLFDGTDWLNLTGSASAKDFIIGKIIKPIIKKPGPKINTGTTAVKAKTTRITQTIKALPKVKIAKPTSKLRKLSGAFQSTTALQMLLQAKLADTIIKNMRSPRLVNRTSRFAESVRVEALQYDNRNNALTAFMTYMKNPYQTFELGYAQGNKSRDPRTLISTSVRELAITLTTARLKAVIV